MRNALWALTIVLPGSGAVADCLDGPLVWVDDPAFVASIDASDPLSSDAALRIAVLQPNEHAGALQRQLAEEVATRAALAMGRSGAELAEVAVLRDAARNGDFEILRTSLFAAPDSDEVLSVRASFLWTFGCAEAALDLADAITVAAIGARGFPWHFALAQADPALDIGIQTAVFDASLQRRGDWPGWFTSFNTLTTWLAFGGEAEYARLSATLDAYAARHEELWQGAEPSETGPTHPPILLLLQAARDRDIDLPEDVALGESMDIDEALDVLRSASSIRDIQYLMPDMLNFLARMGHCPLAVDLAGATLNIAQMPLNTRVTAQAALVRCRADIRLR